MSTGRCSPSLQLRGQSVRRVPLSPPCHVRSRVVDVVNVGVVAFGDSGAIVPAEPDDFLEIVHRATEPVIVHSEREGLSAANI